MLRTVLRKKKTKQKDRNYLEEIIYNWSDIYWLVLPKIMWTQLDMEFLNEFQEPAAINGTKMGDLPLFLRLILCSCATLGLTIGEFLVSNYTHSITLLGAFYPHLLKLLFIYWFYSWMNTLEPVCKKKVHDQLLVCGIGDLWRIWMIPNWLYMSPSYSPAHPGSTLNLLGLHIFEIKLC